MKDMALEGESRIVLIDNGSLNSNSILEARSLALSLSKRLNRTVDTISVAHSDQIPASELGGVEAMLWQTYLEKAGSSGLSEVFAVPLFIGPGFALKKAKRMALNQAKGTGISVRWADPLVSRTGQDSVLMEILEDNVLRVLNTNGDTNHMPRVLLVDHGSPFEEVTKCRNYAADRLKLGLGNRVESVVACSMERREGKEFDFNDPSLMASLASAKHDCVERVIVCYLFLFSGRHAGLGGDIDQICQEAGWEADQNLLKTDLIGSNPKVLDLLETRLNSILPKT